MRENLCQQDSESVPWTGQEHETLSNRKRLEHHAPGDQLLQKILQVRRKFIFIPILRVKNTPRSSMIVQRISVKPQSEEEDEFHNQVLDGQYMCKILVKNPNNFEDSR